MAEATAAAVRAAKEKVLAVMAVDGKVAVEYGGGEGDRGEGGGSKGGGSEGRSGSAAKAATGKEVEERAVVAAAAMVEVGKVWRSGG